MAPPPQRSVAADNTPHSLVDRAKFAAFGVFHSMREKGSSRRFSLRGQLWAIVLRIVDAVQVRLVRYLCERTRVRARPVQHLTLHMAFVVRLWLQVVALCLHPSFGWSASMVSWLTSFSILDIILPDRDPRLFNLVFATTILVVVGALADAVCTSCCAGSMGGGTGLVFMVRVRH